MLSVEEAREKILAQFHTLEGEERPILKSLGQVLTKDIYAPFDVPPADNSAMDGYAVRVEDIRQASPASPKTLQVVAEAAAGFPARQAVRPGTAIRIMTGASVPQGATAVVPYEDTDEEKRKGRRNSFPFPIAILTEPTPGANIRRAGEDIPRGSLALTAGTELCPSHIGVLASLGHRTAPVIRRPVVAVLATGDELRQPGRPLGPGQIYNSNTYSLASQVLWAGGIPRILGVARDSRRSLVQKIQRAMDSDMLITSGGVSKGDYDVVKDVLAQEGEISFWTVRMKPGKPLAFGLFRKGARVIPHLGLPGNPVSVMITFEVFARPAIRKMMGKENLARPSILAIMEDELANRDGRRVFARVKVAKRNGHYFARLTGHQGSGILTSMAWADGLAVIPEEVTQVREGDRVQVMMLNWLEERE